MHNKHRVFGNKWHSTKNKRHLFSDKCLLTAENRAHARVRVRPGRRRSGAPARA